MAKFIKIIFMTFLFLLQGCNQGSSTMPNSIHYYINPATNLQQVGRVAIVEINNYSDYPGISYDITNSLHRAIQKTQIFGITVITKENPLWNDLEIDPHDKYTLEQLVKIRQLTNCNAILTGTVTQYTPYPHTAVALTLKMTDLRDGQLIWAMEQVFDTADKTTEARIKRYLRAHSSEKTNTLDEKIIAVSPVKFIDFVTYEVAGTMLQIKEQKK